MRILVKKNDLIDALRQISSLGISEKLNSDKIKYTDFLFIKQIDNKLVFVFTDGDKKITIKKDVEIKEPGFCFIPIDKVRIIIDFIKDSETSIDISINKNNAKISYDKSEFNIPLLDASKFQNFYEDEDASIIKQFSINGKELYETLNLVFYATAKDENRKALNGVLFDIKDNNLTCVATDGRRLSTVEKHLIEVTGNDGKVIVSSKDINILMKFIQKTQKVIISIYENKISFSLDNETILDCSFINEIYPNYKQIIPKEFSSTATVNSSLLMQKLSSILTLNSRSTASKKHTKMCFEGQENNKGRLVLSSEDDTGSNITHDLDINYNGENISILLNVSFILDVLSKIQKQDIIIEVKDDRNPLKITDKDNSFIYVMMPISSM
jgi:DNA polymerase III subunit beta